MEKKKEASLTVGCFDWLVGLTGLTVGLIVEQEEQVSCDKTKCDHKVSRDK